MSAFAEPRPSESNRGVTQLRVGQLVKLLAIAPAPGAALLAGRIMGPYRGEYAVDLLWRLFLIAGAVSYVLEAALVAPIMLMWPRARIPSFAVAAAWGCLVGLCGALLVETPRVVESAAGFGLDAQLLFRWLAAAWPFGALGTLCGAFYAWLASRAARVTPTR